MGGAPGTNHPSSTSFQPSVNIVIIVLIIVKFCLRVGYMSVYIAMCEWSYGGQKTPSGSVMSSFYLV